MKFTTGIWEVKKKIETQQAASLRLFGLGGGL